MKNKVIMLIIILLAIIGGLLIDLGLIWTGTSLIALCVCGLVFYPLLCEFINGK